jgi:hypothetical protein
MQARRRAGLRSFLAQPPAKTYLKSEHFNGGGSSGPPHVRQMIDSGTSEPRPRRPHKPFVRPERNFAVPSSADSVGKGRHKDLQSLRREAAASGSDPKFRATSVRSSSCRLTKSSKSPAAIGRIQLTGIARGRQPGLGRRKPGIGSSVLHRPADAVSSQSPPRDVLLERILHLPGLNRTFSSPISSP